MSGVLPIDGELTVYTATTLKDTLMNALEANTELTLDLDAVNEVDGAGLQLLLAAKREAAKRGTRLVLRGHSPAVIAAIELIGLGAALGDLIVLEGEQAA